MKKFEIRYEETMVGFFDVEAENEEEAIEKFWELAEEGKIDLLDTEMQNSTADVISVYDEE